MYFVCLGKQHEKGTLLGSNAGITSVEFDLQEKLVLGSSNDHSARVWGVTDQRCRVRENLLDQLDEFPLDDNRHCNI